MSKGAMVVECEPNVDEGGRSLLTDDELRKHFCKNETMASYERVAKAHGYNGVRVVRLERTITQWHWMSIVL